MRDTKPGADLRKRLPAGIELHCFFGLLVRETLSANGDTLFTKDSGNPRLRDAIARTDSLGCLASFVTSHDVTDVFGAQEAL
ncbi:Uncharacterised protein [Mycobacteroides abscessus subsp. massiliense]|nr:Uncharacterised protein [Mycobacteroides abscessus subsp. abscessus]SKE05854.1 Uncharacterised protein [Mycobacteroides abscessus subsp. massiliense]SHW98248.1 Uncharacterised protein [Mycobacteroides abscessus subsp. abscessus]SKE27594.1 Uncharacterised protein [Mycobacteroides abscessus subsp. massiliense]SKF97699.1 Uncharacterised protein [Mycobacteroides abscessus subsp. massiliense]